MADNARGIHVSPGVYAKETELTYAVKSLGITTLGLVGETLKGPAFQPMMIENWREFQSMFGGTSTAKFPDSQYPKYELPYVAKSYLSESNQLQVCRVLGLSGYNAGPAWLVTADYKNTYSEKSGNTMVVAVLRSRGHYAKCINYDISNRTGTTEQLCKCPQTVYDKLEYAVGEWNETSNNCEKPKHYNMSAITISAYTDLNSSGNVCAGFKLSGNSGSFNVSTSNLGRFKIIGNGGKQTQVDSFTPSSANTNYFEYAVSLNPSDNDYILKVLGTDPLNGDTPIYVESLYDIALQQEINAEHIDKITSALTQCEPFHKSDYCFLKPVDGFVEKREDSLTRRDMGKRLLAKKSSKEITAHHSINNKITTSGYSGITIGQIYTVKQHVDENGKRHYYYVYEATEEENKDTGGTVTSTTISSSGDRIVDATSKFSYKDDLKDGVGERAMALVKNEQDGRYYRMYNKSVKAVDFDMNDYKEAYRFASTPWLVSNIKGDASRVELNKLFRFHTISDGNASNNEVKVSIQNIKLDEGVFDVVVRDINDTDAMPVILEKFTKCTMTPNKTNYVAYKIGSYDGSYESKSKYITVEVNETLAARNSVPAGFLGYPLSRFNGVPVNGASKSNVLCPAIKYNLSYDEDVKNRKQYFGFSDISGVDIDLFSYKGKSAYDADPSINKDSISQGFHLDSRLDLTEYTGTTRPSIMVDGISGYTFDCVSTNSRTDVLDATPCIGTEEEMLGSIFEFVDLRKFTVYFYGGFDGWDAYRGQRSNTDEFKVSKYHGSYDDVSGEGLTFNKINNPELLQLNQKAITSDWYAYLSAYRQFSNPESVDINVFATPGIDLINNKTLVQEVIEMIESERADSIYVATMPDKPSGAADYVDDMYTPEDVVDELYDTEIDSNYTCTYYPWIKYEDVDNSQYIYLPPTKDVVRNMAMTDNTTHPWFAPAGISRGDVKCARAHYVTKLTDEDILYEGRINPIKTFASDGVKVWGQKNLQIRESQLNRIAVRRLLLRMRKLIAIACVGLIFEPNDATTKNKFLSIVTPILDNIRANRGISDYRIEVNDTLESRERRELPAKIFFKPYNALEYIDLDFILTPEGVSFDNI